VSDEVYKSIKENCDFKTPNWTDGCNTAMTVIFDQYDLIDIYNIYAPKCLLDLNSSSSANRALFPNHQVKVTWKLKVSAFSFHLKFTCISDMIGSAIREAEAVILGL
jgi:hypothetical protein